ncbi:alkaline phosphatase D [Sphingomonas zeicaulis]|uniref:alkaline phosphatase D family protein n=1 Tax=Sphingomonas zeicaulis TaxID=1632740 RepID=UPI003D1B4E72
MGALTRRALLAGSAAGGLLLAAGPAAAQARGPFAHGVASGDPAQDSVLLWTRVTAPGGDAVRGTWQVAADRGFRAIVASGSFETSAARDHTVKPIAEGLEPGRDYFYRFQALGATSPIGRTRTLPAGRLDRLDLVLACCAMYMYGEFHAYRAIAMRERLDLVLFIGDYIYEYGPQGTLGAPLLRPVEPAHDTVSLADYRQRYAQWRRDPALQDAHARAAWACMWDDHEIANDDWVHGAQHHDPKTNGDWEVRKRAAVQAYLEWMPIRDPAPADPFGVNRSFAFGDLATLAMPETRLKARDEQLSLGKDLEMRVIDARDPAAPKVVTDAAALATLDRKALPAGYALEPDVAGFRRKLAAPGREMIGAAQRDWLRDELKAHGAAGRPWFLFGSQTILSSYVYPDLTRFPGGKPALAPFRAMTRHKLPMLNLDAWDGYPAEREQLYDLFEASGANLLTLSGDSHMAFINESHRGEKRIGLELSASTVTGPSIGELLLPPGPVGEAFAEASRDVLWCDVNAIGFVTVSLTRDRVDAEFVRVLNPRETVGRLDIAKRARAAISEGVLGGWRVS